MVLRRFLDPGFRRDDMLRAEMTELDDLITF